MALQSVWYYTDLPKDDPKRRNPDINLAIKTLNWNPKYKLEFGLLNTIKYLREIGTYDLSLTPEVCDAFGPNKPTTIANQEWLELSEKRVGGIDKLVFESMKNRYTLKLND